MVTVFITVMTFTHTHSITSLKVPLTDAQSIAKQSKVL